MMNKPLRLGVNIDHVATLRQARGTQYPDVLFAASEAISGGAKGITVHLREDRRHIQDADVEGLLKQINVPLNLEMAVTDEMLGIASALKPPHCCLVPEKREELTTEGGLDVRSQKDRVGDACDQLAEAGVRVSLFIDPDLEQLQAALDVKAPVIEIHTGSYADAASDAAQQEELQRITLMAKEAHAAGIEVHGGHGLHLQNVTAIAAIPEMVELNIGHSIVADAVFHGLQSAVKRMDDCMQRARH